MIKFIVVLIVYCLIFILFEYINAFNMTSGSWKTIIQYALRPYILLFFALTPILVWGFNKEIYEFIGKRFWLTGIVMNLVEFISYLIGSFAFYKKPPTVRETIALGLMFGALLLANVHNPEND